MINRNAVTFASIAITAALLASLSAQAAAHSDPTQVRIASGALAGARDNDVVSFKGIPYAAPPIDVLRWRPPQPVKSWSEVRPAKEFGAICQQIYNARDNGVGALPMNEDCLTLNVFAPAGQKKAAPVMFWIHGGGFVNGSGTAGLYDGSALARQGVVVVTLNYRMGRFGFFAHPALTAEAKGGPIGNYGLMDMVAALEWVQANIGKFGGDPKQVTIFGESAGGIAVNALMISELARGLFVRAITESGVGREPTPALAAAEDAGRQFAAASGLTDASPADLRRLSPEQLLKFAAGKGTLVSLIADGQVLTLGPAEGFAKGIEAKVPWVIGWNSLEIPASPDKTLESNPIMPSAAKRSQVAAAYPDELTYSAHVVSDMVFAEPALNLARLHASHSQPTWVYQFSVVSSSMRGTLKGAPHASERQYVFNTLTTSPWPTDANDLAQAKTMSAYWTTFAKTGNPNDGARVRWPAYSPSKNELLDFTNEGPTVVIVPRLATMDAIAALYH
ncbi:MAG: carboxylesterase family protein [Acidobacteriota bacterium]|nr:carboxylesterase family protein [Acidobacteriota bacterium]